jgi:hypothetical protein
MPDHPTLAEQIDAVQWAEARVEGMLPAANMGSKERLELLRRRLEAAVETLRTLEFGSAIAR